MRVLAGSAALAASTPAACAPAERPATSARVANAAELTRALASARPGDTILLAPGEYGAVSIGNLKKGGEVTIASQNPNSPAVFEGLGIADSAGLTFVGIEVRSVRTDTAGVFVRNVTDLKFDGLYIHGSLDGDPNNAGGGLRLVNCSNIKVVNSEFRDLTGGIGPSNVNGLIIADNVFHTLRIDGIQLGGVDNVLIARNHFSDFFQQPADHPDMIQFLPNAGDRITNVTIMDNVYVRGAGGPVQGIFLAGAGSAIVYENITITGNAIIGSNYNGIVVGGADGLVIRDNLVVGYTGVTSEIEVVYSNNVTIADNQSTGYNFGAGNSKLMKSGNAPAKLSRIGDLSPLERWRASRRDRQSAQ